MNVLSIRKGESFAEWKARQPKINCPTHIGQLFGYLGTSYRVVSFDEEGIDATTEVPDSVHGYEIYRINKNKFLNYKNHARSNS